MLALTSSSRAQARQVLSAPARASAELNSFRYAPFSVTNSYERNRPVGRSLPSASWVPQRWSSGQSTRPSSACNSTSFESVPEDVKIEVKPEDGSKDIEYDEENKVVRIPLSLYGTEGQRRSKLVLFTCNKCGGRTARMVNPVAWEKGVVFAQCSKCGVWHVLKANNKKIFEEVRYKDDPEYQDRDVAAADADHKED